ncbi:hypothetical protein GCM10022237_08960 [Nocardioides ginsengisoli]|uniref:Uncharacterized protein n=1 Tax=Nocardioides ginsengisoli TaxID=363868 RepID=A0ABW3W0E0_9ACTN
MTDPDPITLQGPHVTAALPEVKRLVFDYIAERHGPGVERVAVERMLLAHGHHPGAAKVILDEWREAGALAIQTTTRNTLNHYRISAGSAPPTRRSSRLVVHS